MKHPSAAKLADTFRDLTEEQAQLACDLCNAVNDSDELASLWNRISDATPRRFYYPVAGLHSASARIDYVLTALDCLLDTHGVEAIWPLGLSENDCQGEPVAEYLNAGDTYATTLIYHHEADELTIGCWGDVVEELEREAAEEEDPDDDPDEPSGYRDCACRDCFEIAIGGPGALCHDCEAAGCEADNGECQSPHAYGGDLD